MRAKELIKERFGEIMTNKTTQSNQILEYMRQGNSITPLEALNLFGCMRLGARIYDLSQAGHVIHREMVHDQRTGKKYASYRLLEARHA
nr:MAG TPA: helix-turn-helix domain protein [Caudoviricetes sp.]